MKTSLYSILCIVIRLGAVFFAAWIIAVFPTIYISAHTRQFDAGSFQLLEGFYLGGLVVAFGLWLYPGILASLAAGRSTREPFETSIDAHDIQYVALSILGIWLALKGLGSLAFEITRGIAFSTAEASMSTVEAAPLAAAGVEVVLGIALALGGKGVVGLLQRLRYGNAKWEEQQ
jgi:hypothetical protein